MIYIYTKRHKILYSSNHIIMCRKTRIVGRVLASPRPVYIHTETRKERAHTDKILYTHTSGAITTAVEYLVLETAFACLLIMLPAVHNLLRADLPSDIALTPSVQDADKDSNMEPFLDSSI